MKINSPLFKVKKGSEVKLESLINELYSVYEQNFKTIDQLLLGSLFSQKKFKFSQGLIKHLVLSSNQHVPDIHVEMHFLSQYTVDVKMHYKDNNHGNIRYIYNVKFRLFLDAKILEVKKTGLNNSSFKKMQETDKEVLKQSDRPYSIPDKLTKSVLVHKWLNKLLSLEYTLNKIQ